MYTEHPEFEPPENEEVKVWRYMDFTKFVSLIDTQRLYFARADKFVDPFEGSLPRKNAHARFMPLASPDMSLGEINALLDLKNQLRDITRHYKKFVAINCWHANGHESAAMWKLYLKSNEGIAIQSTYKRLRDSIIDDRQVYLGKVKYIDYENDVIRSDNMLAPYMHKRKSFEHEREIRAVVRIPWTTTDIKITEQEPVDHGIQIRINIESLIEKIYIAPGTPKWFIDLVSAVIKRYSCTFKVVQSKLDEQPVF
ncbi:hypothetical protein [Candidatus Nitrotoga fabula]|uniref:DUF2971 domain-containing protein n=1 Tax=Candidatus Nitrotoga fabula TaxID=2182327 RepID=A0A916BFC4_9PROT|nr:hypothetical protein [Candidatus Nitrotoga fabula]CAE6734446.1 conserved hypothetical protein [Candidatus Nitrotoga fabula]